MNRLSTLSRASLREPGADAAPGAHPAGYRRPDRTAMPVPAPLPARVTRRVSRHEWVVMAGAVLGIGCLLGLLACLSWVRRGDGTALGVGLLLTLGALLGLAVTQRSPR